MSALAARIQGELNGARKAQDKERVLLLGTVLSDIKNREIELKRALTDKLDAASAPRTSGGRPRPARSGPPRLRPTTRCAPPCARPSRAARRPSAPSWAR